MSEKNHKNGSKLIFAGTRPEIIKLAPVYKELIRRGHEAVFCATLQHSDLSSQALDFFGIVPDITLDVSQPGQSLASLTTKLLDQVGQTIDKVLPSSVIVQGDTMTVTCSALAAFLRKVPVMHIEAGLRSRDLKAPFPEEANRRICSTLTDLHFVPTQQALSNLASEGVSTNKIFNVGNTVADALKIAVEKVKSPETSASDIALQICMFRNRHKKIATLTMHRRESFDAGLESLSQALDEIFGKAKDGELGLIYPRHPNPGLDKFCDELQAKLGDKIKIVPALGYADFVRLLTESDFLVTDSGGVLEEATILGKPVICVREKIERPEILKSENTFLTGFDKALITKALENCLAKPQSSTNNFFDHFGDGQASQKIVKIIEEHQGKPEGVKIQPARLDEQTKFFEQPPRTVAILGLGYIGLPTATVLAKSGFSVIGVDTNPARLESIKNGTTDFLEGVLRQDLKTALANKSITLKSTLEDLADFYLICVPTPIKGKDADLSYVFACAEAISKNLKPGALVVLESTVPVGTTNQLADKIAGLSGLEADKDFFVAYCPERVIPGRMEKEIIENDRTIGAQSSQAFLLANSIYRSFCTGNLSYVDAKSAELIKLLENSLRNVEVAFANEAYDIARQFNVSPSQVKEIANRHPRVNILNPGPGVGGHCVAVDPFFLERGLRESCPVLSTSIMANKKRPDKIVQNILKYIKTLHKSAETKINILVMGLAYKPNVSDLRESPALEVALKLSGHPEINQTVFDPHADGKEVMSLGLSASADIAKSIKSADLVAVLVAHAQFDSILGQADLEGKIVIDPTSLVEKLSKNSENIKPISSQNCL